VLQAGADATGGVAAPTCDDDPGHSDVLLLVHVVFATLGRRRLLRPEADDWLHAELREQARRLGADALGVGNADDHVHVVLSIGATTALAPLVQRLKGASCRAWNLRNASSPLRWQSGYWVRSVGTDALPRLLPYLRDQRARHRSGHVEDTFEQHVSHPAGDPP
jgi:REP element-mobilizing transposase RayT